MVLEETVDKKKGKKKEIFLKKTTAQTSIEKLIKIINPTNRKIIT